MNCKFALRICRTCYALILAVALAAILADIEPATAAIIVGQDSDGDAISATAEFMADGDILLVALTNTTPNTDDFGDVLTGIEFRLLGSTPTLVSVEGVLREIDREGNFEDGDGPQELSWSLDPLDSHAWQLSFHPDARHGIVGPPTDGDYADTKRSIRGNRGHSPYAAETIVAKLNVPGLSDDPLARVIVQDFLFSGELSASEGRIIPGGGLEIPEPMTIAILMPAFGWLPWRRRGRRVLTSAGG
jgi:hypothetical protein